MAENSLVDRLKEFMEHEARLCSMDFGCITPEHVYCMWGEQAHIKMRDCLDMSGKVYNFAMQN